MGSQKEVRTFRSRWISEGSYRAHSPIPKPSTTPGVAVTVAENLTSSPWSYAGGPSSGIEPLGRPVRCWNDSNRSAQQAWLRQKAMRSGSSRAPASTHFKVLSGVREGTDSLGHAAISEEVGGESPVVEVFSSGEEGSKSRINRVKHGLDPTR